MSNGTSMSDDPDLELYLPYAPVPWTPGRGQFRHTPARVADWKELVREAGRESLQFIRWVPQSVVELGFTFTFQKKKLTRAGDLDNYIKPIKDALTGVYWDDDRIKYVRGYRYVHVRTGEPSMKLRVWVI